VGWEEVSFVNRTRREFEAEAIIHLDVLYSVGLRLTAGDAARAEDLIQETFLHAFRAWHTFRTGSNCRAWLMRILRNLFLDECRKQSRFVSDMEPEALLNLRSVNPFGEPDTEARIVDGPLGKEVRRAIDGLPLVYRETLVLSDLMGLAYVEIAEETGVPVGTVKSRLFRARRMVQTELGAYALAIGFLPDEQALPDTCRPVAPVRSAASLDDGLQTVH
jgi:RNA polymerase sigma-70 factor (ECF subfamily)